MIYVAKQNAPSCMVVAIHIGLLNTRDALPFNKRLSNLLNKVVPGVFYLKYSSFKQRL